MNFRTVSSRSLCLAAAGLVLLTGASFAQDRIDGIVGFGNAGVLRYDPVTPDPGYAAGPLNDFGTTPTGLNAVFPGTDWQPDAGTLVDGSIDDVATLAHPNADACDTCNAGRAFTQYCFRGGIDPAGADWTAGWTHTGIATSMKPAGWQTRPIKLLTGVQPTSFWDADTVYALRGRVSFDAGTSLTIEAGTLVVGENATSGFLVIERGATIDAQGTAADPITMTTDLEPPVIGGWGGIVLHGRSVANCADCLGGASCISEGGNAGFFCGTDDCDGSGILRYVRVGYAGVDVGVDNELNAFTFNGLGTGTTLEFLQAHQGKDDLFEFFGGKAGISNFVGTGGGDDGLDWQMGWRGVAQLGVLQKYPINDGDKGIEADNNENDFDAICRSDPIVSNVTFIGSQGGGSDTFGVHFRRGTDVQFFNSIICFTNSEAIRVSDEETVARGLNPATGAFSCGVVDAPVIANALDIDVRTYPNPVVDGTRFDFYLPVASSARLDVFDVAGRLVDNVIDGDLSAGEHSIRWSPSDRLVAGTYFFRLENDHQPAMGKFVVIN